jgi:hypothetical protein
MIAKFDSKARNGTGKELKAYLENGTKNDRDEKDTRIALFGDIDILQLAIKLGHDKGYKETYRNLVVSFDEDEVGIEDLQKIAVSYIKQYTMGYKDDEIVAYAETHLPKIKYKMKFNRTTQQFEKIKRKPHIHLSFAMYSPKLDKKLMLNSNDKRIYDINLLTRKFEQEYGFAPVEKKAISNDITQVKNTSKKLHTRTTIKQTIDSYVYNNISTIEDYQQLKQHLEHNLKIQIIRESTIKAKTKSITILYNNKKIRLKGDIFHQSTFNDAKKKILSTLKDEDTQSSVISLDRLKPELKEFNQSKVAYIERHNQYARNKAKKKLDEYFYQSEQRPKNKFTTYQEKIYHSIYGKNISYDLKGFYIKKFEHQPIPITVLSNKSKNIKVIDRGDEVTVEGDNLKEEVRLSIELCLAKDWKLEDIESSGSEEFIKESKRQIGILIQNSEHKSTKYRKKYPILNSKNINKASFSRKKTSNDYTKSYNYKKLNTFR